MDRLFLSGLLRRNSSKREARQDGTSPSASASSTQPVYSASALYSNTTGASSTAALAGIGALISVPYAGRPSEQLLFDASTCDLVILVADEINYARPLPAHKDVLRSRNAGGYFARLLADPASFPEYSDRAAGPGADMVAGALAGKPMIRRMHWHWQLASALLSFLYRESCEVAWEQLPELRRLAEEVGARGLMDAVDYLLDPQHLLPWTVADLRAAAVALRRHQLVDAADRYVAAMKSTGVHEGTRMATVVYHVRQVRPKFAMSVSAPPVLSLPSIDGAAPPEIPSGLLLSPTGSPAAANGGAAVRESTSLRPASTRSSVPAALSSSASFSYRPNALPPALSVPGASSSSFTGGGGASPNGATSSASSPAGGSSSSCYYRDTRLGLDIIDGVLRSVALDSKVLRGLLLPGRRRDTVLLSSAGTTGHSPPSWQRRSSGPTAISTVSGGGAAVSVTGGVSGGVDRLLRRPSSPYSMVAGHRSSAVNASFTSTELLPQLGRLRSALSSRSSSTGGPTPSAVAAAVAASGSGAWVGSSSAVQNSCSSFTGGTVFGVSTSRSSGTGYTGGQEEHLEATTTLELMVIMPAAQLAGSLALLAQRPLDSHVPGYTGPLVGGPGPGAGSAGNGAQAAGSPRSAGAPNGARKEGEGRASFDPFGRLSGVPGLSWAGDKGAGANGGVCGSVGSTASTASLLQHLPAASSLGNFDQITLALALDFAASVSPVGSPAGPGGGMGGEAGLVLPSAAAAAASAAAAMGASACRMLASVLSTLGAADHPHFIVRMDAVQASQAVSFERRRAAADKSSLNSLVGALGSTGGGPGGIGGGGGAGSGASFTAATACSAAASAVKTVLGPGNPRDFFIPLPDHPGGAISITLPVGLVLVDPAVLEATAASGPAAPGGGVSISGSLGPRSNTDTGSSAGNANVCTSARMAALMPHLLASATGLSHVISAVGMISQILRVAGEQHGLFSVPVLRASLRITNPSPALLTVLVQTNTYFAVAPLDNTIYIRKSPTDIVRLLQALHSTLPMKSRGSNGFSFGSGGGAANGGGANGDGSMSMMGRGRLGNAETLAGSLSRQATRQRSFRSMEVARTSTTSGFCSPGGSSASVAVSQPQLVHSPSSRRTTTSELNLRGSGGSFIAGGAAAAGGNSGGQSYSHGVPYSDLDRLFPGWHLHVVELAPPAALVDEF